MMNPQILYVGHQAYFSRDGPSEVTREEFDFIDVTQ